jgi:hypothetical protein
LAIGQFHSPGAGLHSSKLKIRATLGISKITNFWKRLMKYDGLVNEIEGRISKSSDKGKHAVKSDK